MKRIIKKMILSVVTVCMTIGVLTARDVIYAKEKIVYDDISNTVLNEDVSLRKESSKTFMMSDHSVEKVIYSSPVHYSDNGEWKEIDNTLIDDNGIESYSTDDNVVGYENKEGKLKYKFSKKSHKSNMVSIALDEYKITWGYADNENRSHASIKEHENSDNPYESVFSRIIQTVEYGEVSKNIDIEYITGSAGIKENIIIKQPGDKNFFIFEYKTKNLKIEKNSIGQIEAVNNDNKTVFIMPSPYMYDAGGSYSEAIHYEIEENGNNKYYVSIIADEEWLNDDSRVYPIVIDPYIKTNEYEGIEGTFVSSAYPNTNYSTRGSLVIGNDRTDFDYTRTLLKFELPELEKSDVVASAKLNVFAYRSNSYLNAGDELHFNMHMIEEQWEDSLVTWNTMPSYNQMVLDYGSVSKSLNQLEKNELDITYAVKKWYEGEENNGIILKSYDETTEKAGIAGFMYSPNAVENHPYIAIAYRNTRGLEDYWDFSSADAGSSGEAYINTYSGNLVAQYTDAATVGEKMPVSISHIYNSCMSQQQYNDDMKFGKGWRLNVLQTVKPSSDYGLSGASLSSYPYVYTDGDGTQHYFTVENGKYFDEDGLGLELTVLSNGYSITDESAGVMSFDGNGKLIEISDSSGNKAKYEYNKEDGKIHTITDGNGHKLTFTYNDENYLISLTEHNGNVTKYTYNNGYLTNIEYRITKDDKITEISRATYSYNNDGLLSKMCSKDKKSLNFEYTDSLRVSSVTEKAVVIKDEITGQSVRYDYSEHSSTKVITSGKDGIIGNNDDITTVLEFDARGRLRSENAYTSDRELGAQAYTYTEVGEGDSVRKTNRVTSSLTAGKSTENLLVNHSGEKDTGWAMGSAVSSMVGSAQYSSEEVQFGKRSLKIAVTEATSKGRLRFYENIYSVRLAANETYTFSAYVKTEGIEKISQSEGAGAALVIYRNSDSIDTSKNPDAKYCVSEYISGTTDEKVAGGWRRISVTFTVPQDTTYIRAECCIRGAIGTAYFDGLQLEKGESASSYNMVENGSFSLVTENLPDSWKYSSLNSGDMIAGERKSMLFTSDSYSEKEIYQEVTVGGKQKDSYIVSAWSHGKGVIQSDDLRKMKLSVKVIYDDGNVYWPATVEYTKNIAGWKYSSVGFTLECDDSNKRPAKIVIYARAHHQANDIMFDDISLVKESVSFSKYDSDGNLIESDGMVQEKKVNSYGGATTTLKENDDEILNIVEDNLKNIVEVSSSSVKTTIGYNEYGSITENIISQCTAGEGEDGDNEATGPQIKTETEYDSTGSNITSTKDEDGYETRYSYESGSGLLKSVIYPDGKEEHYEYDIFDRKIKTTVRKNNTEHGIIEYRYDSSDNLIEISSSDKVYIFEYDCFSNQTSVKIGDTVLSEYSYNGNNGTLKERKLSDNYYFGYEYDEYGRIVRVTEYADNDNPEDNPKEILEEIYNSNGDIVKSKDYLNATITTYDYDTAGQMIRCDTFDMNIQGFEDSRMYGFEYGYNEKGELIREITYNGSRRSITDYTYDNNGSVLSAVTGGRTVSYSYDALERKTSKVIGTSDNITISYEYAPSLRGENYTTNKISKEVIGNTKYSYLYNETGNITEITIKIGNDTKTIQYFYDVHSQLIRENNEQLGYTVLYSYDDSGNIINIRKCVYTTGNTFNEISTSAYGYENDEWKDQLTSYNNNTITYDSIGNPLAYRGYEMTWNGRELMSMSEDENSIIEYTYGSDGIRRTKKTENDIITYDYNGDVLTHEKREECELYYSYDVSGSLVKITLVKGGIGTDYYVTTNFRGDIEGIYNESGQLEARYIYDSWGSIEKILGSTNQEITNPEHIGHINPIRYRGYYYDDETGLYYLQSRYYDPDTKRFINADDIEYVSEDILGTNIYAYCENNPIINSDTSGYLKIKRDRIAGVLDFLLSLTSFPMLFNPIQFGIKKIIKTLSTNQLKKQLKNIITLSKIKSIKKFIAKVTIPIAMTLNRIPKIGKSLSTFFLDDILDLGANSIMIFVNQIANKCINHIDILFTPGGWIAGFFDYFTDKRLDGYVTI